MRCRLLPAFVVVTIATTASSVTALRILTTETANHKVSSSLPRWQAYDNFPCASCGNSAEKFKFAPYNRTVLSEACVFKPHCDRGPHGWTFGNWPVLKNNHTVQSNGGVPQRGNLTEHLDLLRKGVDSWIPNPEFDGNAVFDFEHWAPCWDFDNSRPVSWMSNDYREYSMALVRADHPSWNSSAVEAQAKLEFETAGLEFFVKSLEVIRELRPKAKTGYYGYPAKYLNKQLRTCDDRMMPLWRASTALFPSVYLPPQGGESKSQWEAYTRLHVKETMDESVRIVKKVKDDTNRTLGPILPYHWSLYHNDTTALTKHDLEMILQETFRPPHSVGLVIWGGGHVDAKDLTGWFPEKFSSYLEEVEGPTFKKAYEYADTCSSAKCSGHGWCDSLLKADTVHCICDEGWSGSKCETSLLL